MRAARHVHLADPSRGRLVVLRSSAVLALATFAALTTLLLPGPVVARPATLVGSVATTGGTVASASVSSSGRPSTRGADASTAAVTSTLLVAASHGAGPAPAAALPSTSRWLVASAAVLTARGPAGGAAVTLAGTRTSRAPPTV
jgi:hypothetical protein